MAYTPETNGKTNEILPNLVSSYDILQKKTYWNICLFDDSGREKDKMMKIYLSGYFSIHAETSNM